MDQPWVPLSVVATTIVLGLLLMLALILSWRRRSYRHWSPPLRWAYLSFVACIAVLGAGLWITLWYERHWLAGVSQFAVCAVGFWREVIAPWRASA